MQKIPAHWNLLPIYAGFKNVTENEKVDKPQRLMKVDVIYGSLIKYLPRLTELAYQSLVYNIKTKIIPTVSTYMGFETQKFNVKLPGWWWFADLPTDSLTDINQYCNVMLKHMLENMLATFKKNLLYTREGVVLSVGCNSRAHNNDNDSWMDSRFDDNKNNFILSASLTYILETERFSTSLFQSDIWVFILA